MDFNEWLATLSHPHKFVVLGNHEANAEWSERVSTILTNAHVLEDSGVALQCGEEVRPLNVWGTKFYWPVKTPYFRPPFDAIPEDVDVIVCHGPVLSFVDGGAGCSYLLQHVERVRPSAVVCGHIHQAHGVAYGRGSTEGTIFINAANAGGHGAKEHSRSMGWAPIVLNI